jgi:acyl-[acyl carrier protein]--UDP-N-acetylglucosamine O-acyltransferase
MSAEAQHPTIRDVDVELKIVSDTARISKRAAVGLPGEWRDKPSRFPAVICDGVIMREYSRVQAGCDRKTYVGPRTLLMSGAHAGHDAHIGADCEVAPNAVIGGCCTIGNGVRIGMGAVIRPHVKIGAYARIGMGAVVTRDVPAGETWVGNPARRLGAWSPRT